MSVIVAPNGQASICAPERASSEDLPVTACQGAKLNASPINRAQLAFAHTGNGYTRGVATVQGVWTAGHFLVTSQRPGNGSQDFGLDTVSSPTVQPPCTRPAGGWQPTDWAAVRGVAASRTDLFSLVSSFNAGSVEVPVISATNVRAAIAALPPNLVNQVCVVGTDVSRRQLLDAAAATAAFAGDGLADALGPDPQLGSTISVSESGQPLVILYAAVDDAPVEKVLQSMKPGLVQAHFWLQKQ
ncbi:hypothetical protein acdb102_00030 [Acidothermaceae bacterium B102]|nr:hypothetical protein acdb102_00030 [Acidothermaceae bacterium B102]